MQNHRIIHYTPKPRANARSAHLPPQTRCKFPAACRHRRSDRNSRHRRRRSWSASGWCSPCCDALLRVKCSKQFIDRLPPADAADLAALLSRNSGSRGFRHNCWQASSVRARVADENAFSELEVGRTQVPENDRADREGPCHAHHPLLPALRHKAPSVRCAEGNFPQKLRAVCVQHHNRLCCGLTATLVTSTPAFAARILPAASSRSGQSPAGARSPRIFPARSRTLPADPAPAPTDGSLRRDRRRSEHSAPPIPSS